jgi:hypothetical protein
MQKNRVIFVDPVSICLLAYLSTFISKYVLTDVDRSWYIFIKKKPSRCTISQVYFGKELYMFRTDLLRIISNLNTAFTAIAIFHTSCVDCLLADSQHN